MDLFKWDGLIGFEGTYTIDGRSIACGALSWSCPLPLIGMTKHASIPIGEIWRIERWGKALVAEGVLDRESFEAVSIEWGGTLPGGGISLDVACGMDLDLIEARFNEDPEAPLTIITKGSIRAVSLYLEGDKPAFDNARVLVRRIGYLAPKSVQPPE